MELSKEFEKEATKVANDNYMQFGDGKTDFKYGFIDGATAYANSVERLLKKHIELCEDTAKTTPRNYTQTHEIIKYKKKTYETLLTDLKSIQP